MCNNTENVVHVVVELMQTTTGFRAAIIDFITVGTAAASFHVRRRHKMHRMSMSFMTHKIIQ